MASDERDEWSPQYLWDENRSESPLLSPIFDIDSDYVAYRKAHLASIRRERCVLKWQCLFPHAHWPQQGKNARATKVMSEACILRLILPFIVRLTNLDGKVWEHRYRFDDSRNEWIPCRNGECIKFVVRQCHCPVWRVQRHT